MKKTELLELEKNAHLSVAELRKKKPKLAKPIDVRLERRVARTAASRLASRSEVLQRLVEDLKIPVNDEPDKLALREATVGALRSAVQTNKKMAADEALQKELEDLESAKAPPPAPGVKAEPTVADALRLNDPIAFHPEFRKDLAAAKLFRLSDAVGLEDKTAELLIKEVGRPGDITSRRLETLVKDKKLSAKAASAAGLAASLYNVLDERPELVAAAKPGVSRVRDLVALDKRGWTRLIKKSKTKTPGGMDVDDYAKLLEGKVRRMFPTDALSHRIGRLKIPGTLKPSAAFKKFANRLPGMKVLDLLDDTSLNDAGRKSEIQRRVGLVENFFSKNEDVLARDLTLKSSETKGLKFAAGASRKDKAMVLATARTYQRTLAVTDDIADADALVSGGYHSALTVSMKRPEQIAADTGLDGELADRYHERARDIATSVTAQTGTVIEVLDGLFGESAVGNVSAEIAGYLKEIPGFADFFGNQNFCNCEHCQSILGPAAYFVDLMCFVDEHITQPTFAAKPNHPLRLQNRRPDLWALDLTCENTNTRIPYLVVINEILENAVAQETGFAGDFGDRVAVENAVYRNTLPDKVDSFRQPLNLPFEELRTYIRHFKRTLGDVADAGDATGDALARLRLELPPKDFALITSQANTSLAFLRNVYGIQFVQSGRSITKFDAQLLLDPMGVSREELGELIATRYISDKGRVRISIVGEKRSAESVQNDIENIYSLNRPSLDRMHRFVRLWRATGWRIGELDLVLTHLENARYGYTLDQSIVRAVAAVHRLQTSRSLSVEDAVALWSTVPRHAVLPSPPSGSHTGGPSIYPAAPSALARLAQPLFDRVFNQKSFVDADGTYPKRGTDFLHPALATAPAAAVDPNVARLLSSFAATEDELLQLIVGLAQPLAIDPASGIDADKTFALNEQNLGLLHRHHRLTKVLRVSVPELFVLTAMTPELANDHVEDLPGAIALMGVYNWWTSTDWSLQELSRMLRLSAVTVDSEALANALVTELADTESLLFTETVFALVAPTSPVVVSAGPVARTAGGEAVTYAAVLAGESKAPETVTLAANADLESVIADWNSKATLSRAFRSDDGGNEAEEGTYLAITTDAARGSSTKLLISASPAALFAPAEYVGAQITEAQSRAIFAANGASFESVDAQGQYRLAAGFDPAAALVIPATVDPALRASVGAVLQEYHSVRLLPALLPSRLGVEPSALPQMVRMLQANLADGGYFRELRADVAPARLRQLIEDLHPLSQLFKDRAVFDAPSLRFVGDEPALFAAPDFSRLTTESIRNVEMFRQLLKPHSPRSEQTPDLPAILRAFSNVNGFAAADQEQLAMLLGGDEGVLHSLASNLTLARNAFGVLHQLREAVKFVKHVGLGGSALVAAQATAYADLAEASRGLQAAFRAKYPDESDWEDRVEPFRDKLLSRRRDGLVAFLVHSSAPQFDEVSDLYHYFLLDVQLEGCARTSRVAAAIDSVQLYVHRCLMNLEETPPGDRNPAHVLPESVPADEWEWRQNYRLWEANRKIFLYPENFVEPELRDNKTPLFKQLEEELLSKEITDEAILDAYARYLRGFDELSHLTIAGSYHEKDDKTREDVLHLCGVTSDEPPTYYYRRVENAHYGANSDERATHWGPWEKMDIQAPVRKLSPIVHRGQLYVFWNRYTTKPRNEIETGTSKFAGYEHRAFIEFSKRRLDGSWTTPQSVQLDSPPFAPVSHPSWYGTGGTVADPIVWKNLVVYAFRIRLHISGLFVGIVMADAHGTVRTGPIPGLQLPPDVVAARTETTITQGLLRLEIQPLWASSERIPLYDNQPHAEPIDSYGLRGFGWDRPYPNSVGGRLSIRAFNFQMYSPVDLYRLQMGDQLWLDEEGTDIEDRGVPWFDPSATGAAALLVLFCTCGKVNLLRDLALGRLVWSAPGYDKRTLHKTDAGLSCFDNYTFASVLLDTSNIERFKAQMGHSGPWTAPQWDTSVTDYLEDQLSEHPIATIPSEASLDIVNGSVNDVIIQTTREAVYLQDGVRADGRYELRRLNTSLSEDIADILFNRGLSELLATPTQLSLEEADTPFELETAEIQDSTATGEVDFDGSMGTYLREVFFHIPFLIADHLNSQGRFEDSQKWYHHIFDPTAAETIRGLDPGLSDAERRVRELDRNWRYREFRNLTPDTLRQRLTNQYAIEEYRRDPFNPHAVARLRLSAYQKAILMKYVDNLIDWGDDLFVRAFSQRNPELLRLASLKYVTAQEILGKRPARLGDCGEGKLSPKSFAAIKDELDDDSEFLMEMESIVVVWHRKKSWRTTKNERVAASADRAAHARESYNGAVNLPAINPAPTRTRATDRALSVAITRLGLTSDDFRADTAGYTKADFAALNPDEKPTALSIGPRDERVKKRWRTSAGSVSTSIVTQVTPIFCIPGNERMLAHWDRVEDRLHKLRHCMDIDGVVRQLPLFAPPIDPGLLVGGIAAGLSLDDILAASAGALPPYRFRYLVEKAKGYAATVQAFGSALLAALEKRDAEELARLRNTHRKNMLSLTSAVKRSELAIAETSVEVTRRRRASAQYRFDYYDGLVSSGLSGAEVTQTGARVIATVAQAVQLGLATAAGINYLLPEVGSPFAMKYGGQQVADSLKTFSGVAGFVGNVAEMVATISGIVAGFERREQGWKHQKELANKDLQVVEKELAIAELRNRIATRGLELHEKSKEQNDEIIEFFGDKFSNLGLYTHLSRSLQQLHREAYTNALAIARLAEQAYRFERPADSMIFVGGEWEAARSGLLAGQRLNLALQNMEKRFIETNARSAEINQSFSLAQINPSALIDLKEIGSCEFELPEFFFDMFYPGQYRRRIRAVRLTIPCITGPYTNVSGKLTLLRSHIRKDPALGAANLLEVPPTGTTSVATSTGQGDAGVFELSFRDERYMPFEGAGAISAWRLELPSQFRPFDYQSINDVILNISYTAEEDGVLRQDVESQNAAVAGSLAHFLSNDSLTRVFSLRQEFSSAFNRLTQAAVGTPVTVDINERHFPLFVQGRGLNVTDADVVLAVEDRTIGVGALSLSVNGTAASGFPAPTDPAAAGDPFGGLPNRTIAGAFGGGLKNQHTISIADAGDLGAPAGAGAIDPDKLRDIMLVVQYRL